MRQRNITNGLMMSIKSNLLSMSTIKSAAKTHPLLKIGVCLLLIFYLVLLNTLPSAAVELPDFQERGKIVIAVKDNIRPLGFRDADGNLQGLEIDLATALGKDLLGKAKAVKLQPVANGLRFSQVFNHKVDIAIARVTATESRSRIVDFSAPYYFDSTMLVTKDTSLHNLSDFNKQKIAVLNHSSTIPDIQYYVPNALLVGVDSYEQGFKLTESNAVAAFAADGSVLSGWIQEYPGYHLLPIKLSTEPLCVVMPKGLQYDQLRIRVNQILAGYLESGWLKQRATYWGLP